MALPVDISGQRFGRLVAVNIALRKRHGANQRTKILWNCRCDCGRAHNVAVADLRSGTTQSCGCIKATGAHAHTTHGHARGRMTLTYRRWRSMFDRCLRPKDQAFKYYGGRGITICERWRESYSNFLADMGLCPVGYSLDRINPNGHYEPSNCRWIPLKQQARNTRANALRDVDDNVITWADAAHHLALPEWTFRRYLMSSHGNASPHLVFGKRRNHYGVLRTG